MKSFSQVALSVRSALIERISAVKWESGDGTSGSTTSVRIKLEIEESERRAAVRAWPIKPLAPVMRMFMFVNFGDKRRYYDVSGTLKSKCWRIDSSASLIISLVWSVVADSH